MKINVIKGQYRQGDVLIEEIDAQEPNDNAKKLKRIVLAEGEVTGHAHVIDVESDHADWWKEDESQIVNLHKPAQVKHQEHGAIDLKAKSHRVTRQREYAPEAIRNVAD
jgi:hypothetical protein